MNLLIVYLVTVLLGIGASAWVGVAVDRMFSPFISLVVFFSLFFLTIWLAWKLAVRVTAPRTSSAA